MPGKPGWCAVTCGGVSENLNTVAEKVCSGNAAHAIDSKRIMIHDTCICSVVLCKNTKCAGYQQESLVLLLDIWKRMLTNGYI